MSHVMMWDWTGLKTGHTTTAFVLGNHENYDAYKGYSEIVNNG